MKQRKIFLGIPIPPNVAKRLSRRMAPWEHLPIRFVKEGNMHITLLFLGYVRDESVISVCETVRTACQDIPSFDINLHTITLIPEQGKDAHQLWFTGDPHPELKSLRETMERALDMFSVEKKLFRPHITLGKIRKQLWQELETIPVMKESFSVFLPVESVVVYESIFQKGSGLLYDVLAECPLAYTHNFEISPQKGD